MHQIRFWQKLRHRSP